MITQEHVTAVLGRAVHDPDGHKVGNVKNIYLDTATGQPEWITVDTSLFGTHEAFIPMRDAKVVGDHLEVTDFKDRIKEAPRVDVDSYGHLSADEEQRLYEYYGMAWDEGWEAANDPGNERGSTGSEPADGAVALGAGDTARGAPLVREAGAGPSGGEARAARPRMEGRTESDEGMHVGAKRQAAGRARLQRFEVSEERQKAGPLRHEVARVVKPVTDLNLDDVPSGLETTEAEHQATLPAERLEGKGRTELAEPTPLKGNEFTKQETGPDGWRKERSEAGHADEDGRI
ncbi:PRC-barrel domain-containing protein [Streptomyces sp. NPDC102487]|uniref:PRC-barrel domain-containing protein n=1 Tax=Streptomyces sp. NPDC102487 TaxID=3366182 RepID=UPI003810192B